MSKPNYTTIMKKLLLLILMFFCLSLYSQSKNENFRIVKVGTKYSKELITLAFNKANMCGHFYETKSNDIVFDDGTIVRLLSKRELPSNSGISADCFISDDVKLEVVVWSILPSGHLAKGYSSNQHAKKIVK